MSKVLHNKKKCNKNTQSYHNLPNAHNTTRCSQHYQMFTTLPNAHNTTKCSQHYQMFTTLPKMFTTLPNVHNTTKCSQHYQMFTTLPTMHVAFYVASKSKSQTLGLLGILHPLTCHTSNPKRTSLLYTILSSSHKQTPAKTTTYQHQDWIKINHQ